MKTERMIEMKPQHTSFLIKPPDPGASLRRLPLAALTLILVSALSLSGCPGSDSSSDGPGSPGDTSSPEFASAMVNGATLAVTFNEALGSVPPDSTELQQKFVVMAGPSATAALRVSSVSDTTSGDRDPILKLTLAMPVAHGDMVTLAYTAGTALPISDVAGNPLADFGPVEVSNVTPDAPVLQSAVVNGDTLAVTFNEALGSLPDDSAELQQKFVVMVGTSAMAAQRNVSSVSDTTSGDRDPILKLTLAMPVVPGDMVTLAYRAGTALPISDRASDPLADFGPETVRNVTPMPGDMTAPVFQSAMINGATLTITFNEALGFPLPSGLRADFTVRVTPSGETEAERMVSMVSRVSDGTLGDPILELTLETAVIRADGVTVEYTVNDSRQITDLSANILASFAAQTVQNNTDAMPTPDDIDGDGVPNTTDVDDDGDGLIEIHNLDMLNNVRNKPNGTAYNDGSSDDNTTGCGGLNGITTCSGYELSRDLDFSAADSYADVSAGINLAWRPNAEADATSAEVEPEDGVNPGWMPIGDNSDNFTATFEGNGNTITGLYTRVEASGDAYAGLFGYIGSGAGIRNTRVVAAAVFASSSVRNSSVYAGGLVGRNDGGSISNSYSSGSVSSTSTSTTLSFAYAGGLVGVNASAGRISNSYSSGSVSSSSTTTLSFAYAGGLVGRNDNGSISNSYAAGSVSSSSTSIVYAGGLVGLNDNNGRISNSYATGSVSASSSSSAHAGGLVGQNNGSISNSYSSGSVSASSTSGTARAGGLVGRNDNGSISNSYATGSVSASSTSGTADVGGLVGVNDRSINNSYWDRGTVVLIEDGAIVSAEDQDTGTGDHSGVTALTSRQMQATSGTSGTYPDMLGTDFDLGSASEYPLLEYGGTEGTDCVSADDSSDLAVCGALLPEQAVRMASGFLRFSNTMIGRPSSTDFAFFYDIGDAATIAISGTGVNGTSAGSYAIEDASGTAPTLTGTTISGLGALIAGDEFYLSATFTKGSDSFTQRYRFKK